MISELVLEEFLIENLNLIEKDLTLIYRQLKIMGEGKIDLLCRDKSGHLVVIELKTYANKDSLGQVISYRTPVIQRFRENPRLILVCLSYSNKVKPLCKEKGVKIVKISDPRIPKPGQFRHLNWKERRIINHFLSRTSIAADYGFTLAAELEMPEEEVIKCIEKIREKTSLNIEENKRDNTFTELRLKL